MILIENEKVFTRDDEKPYIENGAVLIDGNVIKEIGKTEDLKTKYPQAEYKDAKGRLVMPGFVNTHMHYYSTFARGMFLGGKQYKISWGSSSYWLWSEDRNNF